MIKWLSESLLGFQYPLNLRYSWSICLLVLIGYSLHGHLKSLFGKNLRQNSPIGAWLVMARVALAHRELEWLKDCSHSPPLMYDGSIILKSSSNKSRKLFPFPLEAWKHIVHCFKISLLLVFLQKSYKFLQGNTGVGLNDLESLSTSLWNLHLRWLGHSQNLMELSWLLLKKRCSLLRMAAEWDCRGCDELSKMHFAEWMESVITIIFEMLFLLQAWLIPHLIAKSSASELVMNTAWWTVLMRRELAWCTCTTEMVILSLILASVTLRVDEGREFWRTKLSSSWVRMLSFSFLSTKLKEKQSENLSEIWWPGVNSWWRGVNDRKMPYDLVLESMIWPFAMFLWRFMREPTVYRLEELEWWGESFIRLHMIWFSRSLNGRMRKQLASFWRWNLIGIIPANALIPSEGNVLKALRIQMAALLLHFV